MTIYGVSSNLLKDLERVYQNMESGEESCLPGCYLCCGWESNSTSPEIAYVTFLEFVYMISDLDLNRLYQLASKPKLTLKVKDALNNYIDLTFCSFVEVKNGMGKCIIHPKQSWWARVYKRVSGKCDYYPSKEDMEAYNRITELNNQITGEFSSFKEFGRMPIRFWLGLITSK